MKNENVIKMARLMVGCTDRTCEDCLSQSKKLFGDNKCALIEYAEELDKAGYRKQSETVKEFAEKLLYPLIKAYNQSYKASGYDMEAARSASEIKHYIDHIKQTAEQFGREE